MSFRFIKGVAPVAMLLLPLAAHAALGGAPMGPSGAQVARMAPRVSAAAASYSVQDSTLPTGTLVREYIANGVVFGVAWEGPAMPDLRQLFGDANFTQYVDAMQAKRATGHERGRATLQQPGLVVHSAGRMRAFTGRAYIPTLLPSGVTPADIQ